MGILVKTGLVMFTRVTEVKERMKKFSRLKEAKETWQHNATREPRKEPLLETPSLGQRVTLERRMKSSLSRSVMCDSL